MTLLHEPTPGASAEPVFGCTARAGRRWAEPYEAPFSARRPFGD
ncbi:hypothetical protein [Streptomyces olivaceoviridis]|nr:hypothetical protein [Streptomyces olivaceoviridis]